MYNIFYCDRKFLKKNAECDIEIGQPWNLKRTPLKVVLNEISHESPKK